MAVANDVEGQEAPPCDGDVRCGCGEPADDHAVAVRAERLRHRGREAACGSGGLGKCPSDGRSARDLWCHQPRVNGRAAGPSSPTDQSPRSPTASEVHQRLARLKGWPAQASTRPSASSGGLPASDVFRRLAHIRGWSAQASRSPSPGPGDAPTSDILRQLARLKGWPTRATPQPSTGSDNLAAPDVLRQLARLKGWPTHAATPPAADSDNIPASNILRQLARLKGWPAHATTQPSARSDNLPASDVLRQLARLKGWPTHATTLPAAGSDNLPASDVLRQLARLKGWKVEPSPPGAPGADHLTAPEVLQRLSRLRGWSGRVGSAAAAAKPKGSTSGDVAPRTCAPGGEAGRAGGPVRSWCSSSNNPCGPPGSPDAHSTSGVGATSGFAESTAPASSRSDVLLSSLRPGGDTDPSAGDGLIIPAPASLPGSPPQRTGLPAGSGGLQIQPREFPRDLSDRRTGLTFLRFSVDDGGADARRHGTTEQLVHDAELLGVTFIRQLNDADAYLKHMWAGGDSFWWPEPFGPYWTGASVCAGPKCGGGGSPMLEPGHCDYSSDSGSVPPIFPARLRTVIDVADRMQLIPQPGDRGVGKPPWERADPDLLAEMRGTVVFKWDFTDGTGTPRLNAPFRLGSVDNRYRGGDAPGSTLPVSADAFLSQDLLLHEFLRRLVDPGTGDLTWGEGTRLPYIILGNELERAENDYNCAETAWWILRTSQILQQCAPDVIRIFPGLHHPRSSALGEPEGQDGDCGRFVHALPHARRVACALDRIFFHIIRAAVIVQWQESAGGRFVQVLGEGVRDGYVSLLEYLGHHVPTGDLFDLRYS